MNEFQVETLTAADFDEWVTHCATTFSVEADYFRRHFEADPQRNFHSIFIIKNENGKIVSTVRVFQRAIYFAGKSYKMGGIGEVSTQEKYRGKGLSAKLLAHAIDYMRVNGFVFSLLYTGLFKHYAHHGFAQIKDYHKIVRNHFEANDAIRPLTVSDFFEMEQLYRQYSAVLSGTIVRSNAYWQSWCKGEIKNPLGLFKAGHLVAYLCSEKNKITEIIGEQPEIDQLLTALDFSELELPNFVETSKEVVSEKFYDHNMIALFQPIEFGGRVFVDSKTFADFVNEEKLFVVWKQDKF